jgi:hypothetical protein
MTKDISIIVTTTWNDKLDYGHVVQVAQMIQTDENFDKLIEKQSVVQDALESKDITCDCGGSNDTIEFDLPDAHDNQKQAFNAALKALKIAMNIYKLDICEGTEEESI